MDLLSGEKLKKDIKTNFAIYQNELKTPEYLVCDLRKSPVAVWGLRLENEVYIPIQPDARGRIWSEQLSVWFGVNEAGTLQVWDRAGYAVPAYEDAIEQRAEALEQRAEAIEARRREVERAEKAEREANCLREASEARIRQLEEELRQARRINPS